MRILSFSLALLCTLSLAAQTGNFDETWKEFLENNRVSNTSALIKPDPRTDLDDYAKYLLMNLNNSFCQSKLDKADTYRSKLAEVEANDRAVIEVIPGFEDRLKTIDTNRSMFDRTETVWQAFLQDGTVAPAELTALAPAQSSCEKQTLAKYSYLQAYTSLCRGEVDIARTVFEGRTLKLAEKTSLRVADVPGLAPEVARMKKWFTLLPRLDRAWAQYLDTGNSPGWKEDFPVYACYPEPNIRALILRGAADVCGNAPEALTTIGRLREAAGVDLDAALLEQLDALEQALAERESGREVLDEAWAAFLPDNRVPRNLRYGYDYCEKLPLIRAYIMDGFNFVCETALDNLEKIDELQAKRPAKLDAATRDKMAELRREYQRYQTNGSIIDQLWDQFVEQGDTLYTDFVSSEKYCDNIQQVKDWTMRGLAGDCDSPDFYESLDKIDRFQEAFDFEFYEALDCRIQTLRIRVWDCRYDILRALADTDTESEASYAERLQGLLDEHDMGERPEACTN